MFFILDWTKQNPTKGIFDSLLECLQSYRMRDYYLMIHSVCVTCDSVAVTMGNKSEVTKIVDEKFPFLILCTALMTDKNCELVISEIS
jgi:hypothetical protein